MSLIHLQTQNLLWFPTSEKEPILQDVNLMVKKNEFIAIVGPNGSGKTSLLRCLYNSLTPQKGNITFDKKNIQHYSRKELAKKMAVVIQDTPTDIELLVSDILDLAYLPHQERNFNSIDPDHGYKAELTQQLELKPLIHRTYKTLSGGEKQRVMIARALLQKPELLILDEPTNHLDITHQMSLLKWIKSLNITVICSLHDLNLAAQYCDNIAILKNGKLIEQGSPIEVLTQSNIKQIFAVDAFIDTHPITHTLRLSFY